MSKKITSPTVADKVTVAIDWGKVRKLRRAKTTWKKIGELTGYSWKYLRKEFSQINKISPLIKDPVALEDFKKNRADILAETQRQLIDGITEEKIKKAPIGTLSLAVAQLYDKERLERGQSTQNIHSLTAILDRLDKDDLPLPNAV